MIFINKAFLKQSKVPELRFRDLLPAGAGKDALVREVFKFEIVAMVFCDKGDIRFSMNDVRYSLKKNQLLFVTPGCLIKDLIDYDGHSRVGVRILTSMEHFRSVVVGQQIWDIVIFLKKHPVLSLSDEEARIYDAFRTLRCLMKEDSGPRFYDDFQRRLFSDALLYELLNYLRRRVSEENGARQSPSSFHRLFSAFLKSLTESRGKIRNVADMAQELCVSPKYLSKVVRDVSGLTPTDWIVEFTVREVQQLLRYTDRPVKEIALSLGFPNPSFFGNWCKRELGDTPAHFRQQSKVWQAD